MAKVKGSKHYQMVVVPHRPLYKSLVFLLFLLAMVAFSFFSYQYGLNEGLALKAALQQEEIALKARLASATEQVTNLRQQLADVTLGGEVDTRANEEVRQTVEQLQDQISQLNEEIGFYKSVMLPNVQSKGLRIERLGMEKTNEPNKFKYSLLLTQIVDKHDYVQGGVELALKGTEPDGSEKKLPLSELSDEHLSKIGFRFRYFQNIDGELLLPDGFAPEQVMIVAKSSGKRSQRRERNFDWQLNGG